ncbi:MAG: type II toxin-antitoxin system RelE/ParE family toxin [Candidatus Thioglobus sp.]|nr:type II toxin-antitoxin system RelE/ParE family toxin [Candidatus Thioglobus sp.]
MKFAIYFRPEAEQDIENAAQWYEQQKSGLGYDFLAEIENITKIISQNVLGYEKIYRDLHRTVIRRFPFNLFYLVEENAIIIIAVIHGSRHPKNWKNRT